jgi:hypothetical protein
LTDDARGELAWQIEGVEISILGARRPHCRKQRRQNQKSNRNLSHWNDPAEEHAYFTRS